MALPLSYTRKLGGLGVVMGGAGFEPAKALPSDLQSDPFDRSGNPPHLVVEDLRRRPALSDCPDRSQCEPGCAQTTRDFLTS